MQESNAANVSIASDSARWKSFVSRAYGVCMSLLYLLVFPCATASLSALSCTDIREFGDGSGDVYLNLYPWVRCDSAWKRDILPPALLGTLFWFIVFPLASTLLLRTLRRRIDAQPPSASVAGATAVWPLCADLLLPYSPCLWYWEQVLLARRLGLIVCVAVIPLNSLYLPLALFSLVQLSALLQHWAAPYSHAVLNTGELVSLYLLLVNYITSLILQTGSTLHASADVWTLILFLLNLLFILVLIGGLFGFARVWAGRAWTRCAAWLETRGWSAWLTQRSMPLGRVRQEVVIDADMNGGSVKE